MDWGNLEAGLLTAPVASATAGLLYFHSGYSSAKLRLKVELQLLHHKISRYGDVGSELELWHECLRTLLPVYLEFHRWARCKRARLEAAWRALKDPVHPDALARGAKLDRSRLLSALVLLHSEI